MSDLIVECSGDVVHATNVVDAAFSAKLPVVTMNAEFQVTAGSYYSTRGFLTEAEGDQPGSLAVLKEDVVNMGFTPTVYGNRKGFLELNPTVESMKHWAGVLGFSIESVTNFTDGTKLQIEQVLVANGLGAEIGKPDLVGVTAETIEAAGQELGAIALERGQVLSSYAIVPKAPASVFIVGTHDDFHQSYLDTYKLGSGPSYVIERPFHLCHIEMVKTIRRVVAGGDVLLNNTPLPHASAAAIVKRPLTAGTVIERGIGSFDVRGSAVNIIDEPNHVPIGLLYNAVVRHSVEPGQVLTWDDVDVPMTKAAQAWLHTSRKVLAESRPRTEAAPVPAPVGV